MMRALILLLSLAGCASGDRFNVMPPHPVCVFLCITTITIQNTDTDTAWPDE